MRVKFVKGAETHLPWEFWYSLLKKDSQENCTLEKCGKKRQLWSFVVVVVAVFVLL